MVDLKVTTLNCAAPKYFGLKHRQERIFHIADKLVSSDYNLVALQELWVFDDYEHIRTKLSVLLPYSKFFYSGVFGAGLALFSAFPILTASLHSYSLNGSPLDSAGDWFVGKAVASVSVAHPLLGTLDVYTTHMYAGTDLSHALCHAWEFSKLIRNSLGLGRHVIAMGDFSSLPSDLTTSIIREHTSLVDAWASTHDKAPVPEPSIEPPTPARAIELYGVTVSSPLNSFNGSKTLSDAAKEMQGERLDYIYFLSPPPPPHLPVSGNAFQLHCKSSNVTFTDQTPGQDFSYSDHFGVDAVLQIKLWAPPPQVIVTRSTGSPASIQHTIKEPGAGLDNDTVATMLQVLVEGYRDSRSRARRRHILSILCLLALILLMLASPFLVHPWSHSTFAAASAILASLATTYFYVGFLHGNCEINALMSMIEELELYRHNNVSG